MQSTWGIYTMALLMLPVPLLNFQEARRGNGQLLIQDSIIVAKSNQPIVINASTPTAKIQLKPSDQQSFQKNKKYCLLMAGIELKKPPEGVYEIYILPSTTSPTLLASESAYFIDVLNTYNLGSSKEKNRLYLDVTSQLLNQNSSNKHLLNYTVTVAFKGNIKPDKTSTNNAGILIIESLQLLQTDRR